MQLPVVLWQPRKVLGGLVSLRLCPVLCWELGAGRCREGWERRLSFPLGKREEGSKLYMHTKQLLHTNLCS